MTEMPKIRFTQIDGTQMSAQRGTVVVMAGQELALSHSARSLDKEMGGQLLRAAKAAKFTGTRKSAIEILAPSGLEADRVILLGVGDNEGAKDGAKDGHWSATGGYLYGQIAQRQADKVRVIVDPSGEERTADIAADLAFGAVLRSYNYNRLKTKPANNGTRPASEVELTFAVADPDAATASFERRRAEADGVFLARDLVNEPANLLGPAEFAERLQSLSDLGVEVEVLEQAELEALGMHALLAVGRGSSPARASRVVVMQWHGTGNRRAKPVAFVGKGVVFDSGGLSIKPAKGMEDMKGDMAGAAAVSGLMCTLATRKAKVNAVGVVGLVENMVSGDATRPGDIIGSLSGQTIEVLNTDAEGRLVLADALSYTQDRFKPKFVVNLATLTGAIMVALGKHHAGLFSNNDRLAGWLAEAGEATGERLWRMPLGAEYDKDLDSPNADMRNIGGRFGGAITAAQFLQRFIDNTPWAHLDIAGTAMASNRSDINESWGSGFGVRLLDRLVADHYEGN